MIAANAFRDDALLAQREETKNTNTIILNAIKTSEYS